MPSLRRSGALAGGAKQGGVCENCVGPGVAGHRSRLLVGRAAAGQTPSYVLTADELPIGASLSDKAS